MTVGATGDRKHGDWATKLPVAFDFHSESLRLLKHAAQGLKRVVVAVTWVL
jgi:hypothetical protein